MNPYQQGAIAQPQQGSQNPYAALKFPAVQQQRQGREQRELSMKFRVLKIVGKGSYGSVYQVQRLDDQQIYALKVGKHNLARLTGLTGLTDRGTAHNSLPILKATAFQPLWLHIPLVLARVA